MTNIQTYFVNAGKWCCLALDYIYAVIDTLVDADENTKMNILNTALFAAYITGKGVDKEFYVYDPKLLMETTAKAIGKEIKVNIEKKDITSVSQLPKGYAAVRFDFNNNSHFVLVKDNYIYFNSLEFSNCVSYGKPTTARVITIEKNI